MHAPRLQSNLARARGFGAAHRGVEHWWVQRLTALALAPLSIWFLGSLMAVARIDDPFRIADWMASPYAAIGMVLFAITLFWHAKLGAQVIIEDYVHAPWVKYTLLVLNTFVCWSAAAIVILAVIRLHLFDLVAGT